MATKKKEEETRYMEMDVPQEILSDVAEIIGDNDIDATILSQGEEQDTIKVGFDYATDQRENIMEILELIEDYNNEDEEEEQEEN
ncbi:MAG: hypothetical protein ACXVPU_16780 [Bacteroidia bacterium]